MNMKKFLLAIFLALAPAAFAGYTYYLTGCTQDDIEGVIYRGEVGGVFVKLLEAGDVVVLPAGSATWGDSSRPNSGKIYFQEGYSPGTGTPVPYTNVTFRGQGDSTIITLHESGATYAQGVINLGSSGLVFRDIKIKSARNSPVTAIVVSATGCRISNVTYEGQTATVEGGSPDGYFVFSTGWPLGTLIDHCHISAAVGNHEWIFTRGRTDAWQQNSPIGTSQQDVFVEDCTFTNLGYSDANANASHVFRFNTITGTIKFDAHGSASNSPARSFRSIEYYHNAWTSSGMSSAAAMEIRGGTGMVFNNTSASGQIYLRDYLYDNAWPNLGHFNVTIATGSPTTITTNEPHNYQTGWPIYIDCAAQNIVGFYPITVTSPTTFTVIRPEATNGVGWNIRRFFTAYDYPIADQVGSGKDGAAREPMYLWGNTQGGGVWARSLATPNANAQTLYAAQVGTPGATFNERDVIAPNRDFFASAGFDSATGVSVGTRAAMDAYTPSIVGYGWWVTDEGSWNLKLPANTSGRLYRWTGSAWALYYTPYTYPHPLQNATDVSIPEASPQGGTFEYPQTVAISISPVDATVRYTTDGSTPSHTVGTIYTGTPISVSSTTTIKAIGYKTGLTDSPIMDQTYVITGQVFAPTSNKATADYHGEQIVTLATSTAGAVVHYTLDGTTPTSSSATYSGPISVTSTTTIKAIATKAGLTDSTVLTVGITILNEVGNWDEVSTSYQNFDVGWRPGMFQFVSPITGSITQISIKGTNTSPTQDIAFGLYHATDPSPAAAGLTKVTGTPQVVSDVGTWTASWKNFSVSFPVTAGERYWVFVQVSEAGLSVPAYYVGGNSDRWNLYNAFSDAWVESTGATTNADGWKFNVKAMLTEAAAVAQPSFSPAAGTHFVKAVVSMTTATPGASMRFTLDGTTTPTASVGTIYTGPLTLTGNTTVKAIGYNGFDADSTVRTGVFTILPTTITATTANVGTVQ